tara:strand:- start:26661 stop:27749 length:1089 start_codon:yes stop_codon:yes gene_type:complete
MPINQDTKLAFLPYASNFFARATNNKMYALPRYKFMYYVRFNINPKVSSQELQQVDNLFDSPLKLNGFEEKRSVSFLVKKIDRPKVDLVTQESNQYNLRRQNYTKVTYRDVSMTLHDTSDNRALNLWINYFRFYFGDSQSWTTRSIDNEDALAPASRQIPQRFETIQYGYGLSAQVGARNFFDSIEIWSLFGGSDAAGQRKTFDPVTNTGRYVPQTTAQGTVVTKLMRPRITSIDWGNFDSSDSALSEVTMNFKYESIVYENPTGAAAGEVYREAGFDFKTVELPATPETADIQGVKQPVDFDRRVAAAAPPNTRAQQPQGDLIYSPSPLAQSVYVPFIGAVGGAVNISPVISPFGILVFGL